MYTDLEQALTRELDGVASRLVVPPLPALPDTPPRSSRWRAAQPLLIAAVALVAVMATLGALLLFTSGEDREEPAPAPTPTTAEDDGGPISRAVPDVPYVLGNRLFVGGRLAPGLWFGVQGTADGWIGWRSDGTWWRGNGIRPEPIEGTIDQSVTASPDGGYQAYVVDEGSGPTLTGASTEVGGEGLGGLQVADSDPAPYVPAVTDGGLVVVRGADYQLLWRPLVDGESVDLAETAPGQVVIGNTAAGLLVVDGRYDSADGQQGDPYLATLGEDGTLTRVRSVPAHADLIATQQWLAWSTPGTGGGESTTTGELRVERVGGDDAGVLTPPDGFEFAVGSWRWEDDENLIVVLVRGRLQQLARCRPARERCILVPES